MTRRNEQRKWLKTAWRPAFARMTASILGRIVATQRPAIRKASRMVANAIRNGGLLYVFGSGHSLATALEAHGRAGGLVPVDIILDPSFGKREREEGYAAKLIRRRRFQRRSAMMIISNSGRNALPVEMALEAKRRRMRVIAITSLSHSRSVASRHPCGKRLFEIANVVIDNCGVPGDAVISLPDVREKVGPTSAIAGAFIVELMVIETVERLSRLGVRPPILISANSDGGDAHNRALRRKYAGKIRGMKI